ncbi:PRTRC system protein E [Pedobacter sp. R-06]|uniref:PRTRC system protein E n=1 Tax=Pedobacter sp. R-06 TaxID=3404051 RepID=UPI003CEBE20E
MRTNFFQAIQRLQGVGAWVFNISFAEENEMVVSVLLKPETNGEIKSKLPPMVFKGTAQELDEGILEGLTVPISETKSLFTNISAYNKGLEDARAKIVERPKPVKATAPKVAGETTLQEKEEQTIEDRPTFEDIIREIGKLNSSCKYAEAIAMLPKEADYPDKKAEIGKLARELEWKKNQLTLL